MYMYVYVSCVFVCVHCFSLFLHTHNILSGCKHMSDLMCSYDYMLICVCVCVCVCVRVRERESCWLLSVSV